MSAEVWVALIVGGLGFVVGVCGLVVARSARDKAAEANRMADRSNTIARESNDIAKEALQVAKEHGDEQLALHRQELEVTLAGERRKHAAELAKEADRAKAEERREQARLAQEERQRDLNRARFDVTLGPRDSRGRLKIQIVNRGPSTAREVAATLTFGEQVIQLGSTSGLVENGQLPTRAELGAIAGTYDTGPDNNEVVRPAISGDLTLTYTDGNGPQTLHKRLNIGPGSRFDRRDITITDE
jgi:hypothetical protein